MSKTFTMIAAIMFLLAATVHAYRVYSGFAVVVAGHTVPVWGSWIGVAIAALFGVMFFKKNTASEPAARRAVPAPPQSKRPSARSAAPSIISPDLVVNGTLSSAGEIQIDGRIEGIVQCTTLVVGDKALIHGDVFAQHVTVRGRIEGNIRSKMVLFCATCHVEGDILHQAFAVEPGAFLDSNCRHSDNPLDGNAISNGDSADNRSIGELNGLNFDSARALSDSLRWSVPNR